MNVTRRVLLFTAGIAIMAGSWAIAGELEARPEGPEFEKYQPLKAPPPGPLLLKEGDQLAICGDSITEQKKYSRILETYLTVCVPELKITTRTDGWGGQTAEDFLRRMNNDCLRFKPTVVTLSYGMNDSRYRPYDEANGKWFREKYTAVVKACKAAGARVVVASPGCIGKSINSWVKTAKGTLEDHNLNLCELRNIALGIAAAEEVRFVDMFWPMYTTTIAARKKYGPEYELTGKDGVHPDWAGHLFMAYCFLKAMGLNGEIGTFSVDLGKGTATASAGHEVKEFQNGALTVISKKYPFCAAGDLDKFDSIRSGMTLVPFNQELNRLILTVSGGSAAKYKVTWGENAREYTVEQLAKGINLADDFAVNPFSVAFTKVDKAVASKQDQEWIMIHWGLHGHLAKTDMEGEVRKHETTHAQRAAALAAAFVPVTHTIRIEAQP